MTDQKPIHAFAQAGRLRISTPITGLVTKLDFGDNSKEVNLEIAVSGEKLIVPFSPKLLRRVQDALKAAPLGTIKVILTGVLDLQAKQVNRAGISTQLVVKTNAPKPDASNQTDASVPAVDVSVPDAIAPADAAPPAAPPVPIVTIKKKRIPVPSQAVV
ncbi:MAG: hypothetical protein JZU64_05075 [Rhodoferax sp.]|nr:hypothetical protein [Rhodoferax sp.]